MYLILLKKDVFDGFFTDNFLRVMMYDYVFLIYNYVKERSKS